MERTDTQRPADLPAWMGGPIPDGDTVPQPDVEPAPPGYYPPRRGGIVTTIAVCALIVVGLMALGIAGVWS